MMILTGLPEHTYAFAAILAVLLLSFVLFFLIPSFIVSRQLSAVIKKLILLNGKAGESLDQIFRKKGVLDHLWQEYADSLHKQLSDGKSIRLRSTMPAGVVFRPDILIDIPLRADFFKHLPGLFTGVGIIGTFYGLLIGMKSFVVSNNSVVVRESLTRLLHGVSEAFLISATAITLAMIVTFIEKLVVSRLNAKVEKLAQLLDGLFEGGAGEEYLARLVQASESSSTQMAGLLRGELKGMLAEMTEKQITAASASSAALGERIAASIEAGMKTPLTEIADLLKNAQAAQQLQLKKLLDDFGGQMKSQGGLQQKTIEALQVTTAKIEMMGAGQRGTIEQLAKSNAAAESRQVLLHEKLGELIEQMHRVAGAGEADEQLQNTLNELSGRVAALVDSIQMRETGEARRQSDAGTQHEAGQVQINAIIEGVSEAVEQIRLVVTQMHAASAEMISTLNTGVQTLGVASRDFAQAGRSVSAMLDHSAVVAGKLVEAAGSMSAATTGLGEMFVDYQAARDAVTEQVRSLQSLAEQVRRDASMSGEVLDRIESATGKLVAAQQDADNYLSKISDVIGVAHQSFSEGMSRAVGEANREFHQALSDSVKLLREGIHELESTLDAATSI